MKILLTSVCRPMGPQYGDASSVGYELLYRQVTRAQGIFSPRTVNIHFSLEYIAENLDAPTVVHCRSGARSAKVKGAKPFVPQ